MKKSIGLFILGVCVFATTLKNTEAAILITVEEVAGDVVATLTGDFDLDALGLFDGNFASYDGHAASQGGIAFNSSNTDVYQVDLVNFEAFGTSGFSPWDSSSGDSVALFTDSTFGLPVGYTSGTALNATATANGVSIADLGFTPGTYVNTLTNTTSDTITINVVPEPSTYALLAIASAAGLLFTRRRKEKVA